MEALVVGEDGVAPDPSGQHGDPDQAPVHAQLPEPLGEGEPPAAREGLGAHRQVVHGREEHRERRRDRHATRVVRKLASLLHAPRLRPVVETGDAHQREDDAAAARRADGQDFVPRGEHLPPVGHHVRVPAGPRPVAHARLVEVAVDPPAPVQPRVPHPKQIRRLRAEPPRRDDHAEREHPHRPRVQEGDWQLRVHVEQQQVHEQLHTLVQVGFCVEAVQDNHAGVCEDVPALGGDVLRLAKQKRAHVVVPFGGHGEYVERPAALHERGDDVVEPVPHAAVHAHLQEQGQDGEKAELDGVDGVVVPALLPGKTQRSLGLRHLEVAVDAVNLEVRHGERGVREDVQVHAPRRLHHADEETGTRKVQRKHPQRVHALVQPEQVPGHRDGSRASRNLLLEPVDGREAHVASFAALDELLEDHAAAPRHRVDPAKQILGDVQRPARLAHAPVGHRESLVPDVGVAVVEPDHERPRHQPLERLEDKLGDRGELRHRAVSLGEDRLREADQDDAVGFETVQKVPHLVRLAHVVVLVHVQRLQVRAPGEYHGVVLVLGFALADDGVTGKLDSVVYFAFARRLVDADEAGCVILDRRVRRHVHEAHPQIPVAHDELLDRLRLEPLERARPRGPLGTEDLRADQKLVLASHQRLDLVLGVALEPGEEPERVAVQRHPADASRQGLAPVARPRLRLRPVVAKNGVVVGAERAQTFLQIFVIVRERRDDERKERLLILQRGRELAEAVLDVLGVIRRERGPRWNLRHGCRGPQRGEPEGVAEEHQLSLRLFAPRLTPGVAVDDRSKQARAHGTSQRRGGRRRHQTHVLRIAKHVSAYSVEQVGVKLRHLVLALVRG